MDALALNASVDPLEIQNFFYAAYVTGNYSEKVHISTHEKWHVTHKVLQLEHIEEVVSTPDALSILCDQVPLYEGVDLGTCLSNLAEYLSFS